MKAFKCDHCGKFFTKASGTHRFDGEVCDAEHGFVRYRVTGFIFGSGGPPTLRAQPGLGTQCESDVHRSDKEFCDDCIKKIMLAAVKKEKL